MSSLTSFKFHLEAFLNRLFVRCEKLFFLLAFFVDIMRGRGVIIITINQKT